MSKEKNFLDFVPVISSINTWSEKDGKVTIHMVNKGFYPWIAQTFFKRPKVSHIDLDEYGSFIWKQIDGEKNVGEIAIVLKEKYGDKAEPLYNRLVKYMQILRNNRFVYFKYNGKTI